MLASWHGAWLRQPIAAKVEIVIQQPYLIRGERISCTASIGIALKPRHGDDVMQLIRLADEAMYLAKSKKAGEAANDGAAFVEASEAS